MTQRIVNEEITRARHLMGYNVGLTLNEQTTGLMGVTMNTCTGGTVPPDGNSYAMQYAITINGNNPTQADIGKTIISSSYYLGYLHGTVTSVFPASIQQGTIAHAFTEQPCTGTTGGTVTCYGCDAINGAGGSTTVTSQQFQNNQLSNPYMMLGATQSYCGSWPTTFFTDQAAVIAQCQSGTTACNAISASWCSGGTVQANTWFGTRCAEWGGGNPVTQSDVGAAFTIWSYGTMVIDSVFAVQGTPNPPNPILTQATCPTQGGMITCYGCPGHMQPLETQQFQGPAGAPPYNPDPNMNWGNWCGFGQSSSGYISYWEDQSLVSAICNSGTTTGSTGCANITYNADCGDNAGGANNTQHNDGCSTIDGNMPDSTHVGSYITRPNSPNIFKVISIGDQNTTNNGHSYTSAGCTGGPTPGPTPGPTTPQREEPCEEFRTWPRGEQRDFCAGCRRDPDEPMCKCCRDR